MRSSPPALSVCGPLIFVMLPARPRSSVRPRMRLPVLAIKLNRRCLALTFRSERYVNQSALAPELGLARKLLTLVNAAPVVFGSPQDFSYVTEAELSRLAGITLLGN